MWQLRWASNNGAYPLSASYCRVRAYEPECGQQKGEFSKCVTLWAAKGQVWQSPVVKGSQGLIKPAKSHWRDGWPQRCSLWQESQTISYFFFPWQVIQTFSSIYLDLFVPPAIKSALKNTFSCLAFLERRWGSQKNKNRGNNKSKESMKSGTLCLCLRQYSRKILLFRSQENSIAWINIFSEPSVFLKVELDVILKKKKSQVNFKLSL